MPYIPPEDIKKRIVNYLEKSINSKRFDFKNLSFNSINFFLKNISQKRIENALDELVNEGEILKFQSNLELYIPKPMEKHKNLKPLKLSNPFNIILYNYISGLFVIVLSVSFVPYFREWLLSLDFSRPENIISYSVILGTILPFIVGAILRSIYLRVSKLVENVGLNKGALITIISSAAISLLSYIILSYQFQFSIEPSGIFTSLGVGIALGIGLYSHVFKKRKKYK